MTPQFLRKKRNEMRKKEKEKEGGEREIKEFANTYRQ
jgi:hypothetical protein